MNDEKKNEERPKSIEITYTTDRDYRQTYVNGIVGGMTPRGELRFDLFHEYVEVPNQVTYELTGRGLGEELSKIPEKSPLVRERKIGLTIPIESAESIALWILDKVKEIREIREEAEKGGET
jgi:hypothetical protein